MFESTHVKFAGVFSLVAICAALACAVMLPAQPAYAVTSAEKAAEAQAVLDELDAMQVTLEELSAKYFATLQEYADAVSQADAAQARIDEISDEIADIQSRLSDRAREMYRNGSASFLDLLFGSATFDEFSQNWDLLTRLNTNDADLSLQAKALREEAEEQKAIYTEQAALAEEKSNEASEAFEEAKALAIQMEETYNSLSAEAAELYEQEQIAAAQAAAAAQAYAVEGGYENEDGTVTDASTGQVYSSPAEYSAATGNAVVDRAMAMLGHAYSWGGTGADGTFDCSGLVGYALTGSTNRIGNTSTFQTWSSVPMSDLQPGDVVSSASHAGIYIGNGQMVHASDYGTGVVIGNVQSGMSGYRY